jgi:hypothetical protein
MKMRVLLLIEIRNEYRNTRGDTTYGNIKILRKILYYVWITRYQP